MASRTKAFAVLCAAASELLQPAAADCGTSEWHLAYGGERCYMDGDAMTISCNDQWSGASCGARMSSDIPIGEGQISVTLKAASGSGVATTFYLSTNWAGLYDPSSPWNEIDFEILGKRASPEGTDIWTNLFTGTAEEHHEYIHVPFDVSADFHTYTIDVTKDQVKWIVDGKTYRTQDIQSFGDVTGARDASSFRAFISVWGKSNSDPSLNACPEFMDGLGHLDENPGPFPLHASFKQQWNPAPPTTEAPATSTTTTTTEPADENTPPPEPPSADAETSKPPAADGTPPLPPPGDAESAKPPAVDDAPPPAAPPEDAPTPKPPAVDEPPPAAPPSGDAAAPEPPAVDDAPPPPPPEDAAAPKPPVVEEPPPPAPPSEDVEAPPPPIVDDAPPPEPPSLDAAGVVPESAQPIEAAALPEGGQSVLGYQAGHWVGPSTLVVAGSALLALALGVAAAARRQPAAANYRELELLGSAANAEEGSASLAS